MATRTGDAAWRNLRPPLVNLSAAAAQEMLTKYAAA